MTTFILILIVLILGYIADRVSAIVAAAKITEERALRGIEREGRSALRATLSASEEKFALGAWRPIPRGATWTRDADTKGEFNES